MAVEFASNGRVFVAEKSGRVKVFDNLSDTTPTLFADLRTKVHDYWDRGVEGMVLAPELPDPALRLRLLRARRRDRRHGAALGRHLPRPARRHRRRLRRERPRVEADRQRQRDDRLGAGARRGLLHAVPEPRGRRDGLRRRRLPVRDRRRGRGLALQRLRAGREPGQPVRRPAGRPGHGAHAADGGGRAAARAGHAHDRRDPAGPERLADPHRPEHRPGSVGQPLHLELRPEGPPHHRLRLPQPVPAGDPPRAPTRRGSATSATRTGRRSTAT